MGMKVQFKNYNPTRDINEDKNSSNVTQNYGRKPLPNGQFYNDFIPRTSMESYPVYDSKYVLRQKMLEHEAVFRNQVYELHRLYRIQRDLMEEVRRNGSYKNQISMEGSSSSNRLPYQNPPEDSRKRNLLSVPLLNPSTRPSNLGGDVIINSPLSCTNGTSQLQNDSTPKDLESSRPSKVRKKLFDLQLPADQYIDDSEDGEQVQENDHNNHTKLFLGGKNQFRVVDSLKQDSLRGRGSVKLADLNEPIQIEATNGVDLFGSPVISHVHNSPFLALPQEYVNGSNNPTVQTKGNGRGLLSYMHEAGSSRSNPNPFPQRIQPEQQAINSHPVQFTPNTIPYYNQQLQPVGIFPHNNISRVDLWGDQKGRVLDIPNRIQERCNYGNNLESVLVSSSSSSRMPSSYPFLNPPELSNSWPHSALPWGNLNNPMNNYTQKLMPVQMHPSFNTSYSGNPQLLDQTQADDWQVTRMMHTPMLQSEQFSIRNGVYPGSSSSGPKQLSAAAGNFDYMNRSSKGSNFMELMSNKEMNLNAFPPNSYNEVVVRKDTHRISEKLVNSQDPHVQALPWLRPKPIVKTEPVTNIMDLNSSNQIYDVGVGAKDEKRILGVPIFGIPRPAGNHYPFVLPTTNTSASTAPPELEDSKSNVKRILIDINVACDDTGEPDSAEPPAFIDKGKGSPKTENHRIFIDLNLCASDDEGDQPTPPDAVVVTKSKVRVEIDLEAYPSDLGSDEEQENQLKGKHKESDQEQEKEQVEVECVRAAAEAIMAISTAPNVLSENSNLDPFESAMADSLLLLFNSISGSQTSSLVKETNSAVEIDYYELMTLQLPETKEEDYMPHYSTTNFLETDEAGLSFSPNRPRRGQARRGRPRRDFQRDILPGIISLSRHQITDDLQTFGGLMRATGHNWPAGSSRRNGGRGGGAPRGRRRAVTVAAAEPEPVPQPPPVVALESPQVIPLANHPTVQNTEVGLKDTNLTGWGKTTRRPRRQRCSAGNAIAVALT